MERYPTARRHHRSTWLPSAIFDTYALPDAPPYTQMVTVGCTDDFLAVRVGLPNVTALPWRASRIAVRPSASWSDYINPTGEAPWTPLTFAYGGADREDIATAADLPSAVTVGPNQADPGTGEATNPAWTWTDWASVRSLARSDDPSGLRVMMIRMAVPQRQTITYANGAYATYAGNPAVNLGLDYATGKCNLDIATDPGPVDPVLVDIGHGHNSIACVQFLTRNAGIVGMVTGDSHHAGTSTVSQLSNFLLKATAALAMPLVGKVPVGYATCATGGAMSRQFFPRLLALLPAVKPSFVVLPGWTFNDARGEVHADQALCDIFYARLLQAVDACLAYGTAPILVTPFPRDAANMTDIQIGPWLRLRNAILALRAEGRIVVDATPLLGRQTGGVFDGTYLPGLSDDAVHPNDAGHQILAGTLAAVIASIHYSQATGICL